jgi:hypothetical protein
MVHDYGLIARNVILHSCYTDRNTVKSIIFLLKCKVVAAASYYYINKNRRRVDKVDTPGTLTDTVK